MVDALLLIHFLNIQIDIVIVPHTLPEGVFSESVDGALGNSKKILKDKINELNNNIEEKIDIKPHATIDTLTNQLESLKQKFKDHNLLYC